MGKTASGNETLSDLEAALYNTLKEILGKNVVFYFNAEFIDLCCRKVRAPELDVYKALYSLIYQKFIVPGTSLTRERVLENPTRKHILTSLKNSPGIHIRGLCSALNKRIGVILAHLEVLETFGFIRSKKFSPFKPTLLFLKEFPDTYDAFFLITKNQNALNILRLLTNLQLTVTELSSRIQVHHSTIQYHLDRLERLDLVIRMVGDHITKFTFNKSKLEFFTKFSELYLK